MRKFQQKFWAFFVVFVCQFSALAEIYVCDEYADDIKKIEKDIFSKKGADYYDGNQCQSHIKNTLFCENRYGDLRNKYNELLSNLFVLKALKELKADVSKSLEEVYYFQDQDIKKFEENLKSFKQASFTGSLLQESFKSRIGKNASSPWVEFLESGREKNPESLKTWVHKKCENNITDAFCVSVKASTNAKIDEKTLYSQVLGFISTYYHVPQDEKKDEALANLDAPKKLDEFFNFMNFKNGDETVSMSKLLELSGANKLEEILIKMKADPTKKKEYEQDILKLSKNVAPFLAKVEINNQDLSESLNKQHLLTVKETAQKNMNELFTREDRKKIESIEIDQVVLKEDLIKKIQEKFEKHQKLKASAYLEDTYGQQGHQNDYKTYEEVKKKILNKNCNDELRAINIQGKANEEAQFAALSQIGTCYFGSEFKVTSDSDIQAQIEAVEKNLDDHKIALNLFDKTKLFPNLQSEKKNLIRNYFTECSDNKDEQNSSDLSICPHNNEAYIAGGTSVGAFIDRNLNIVAHSNLELLKEVQTDWDKKAEDKRNKAKKEQEEAKNKNKDGTDDIDLDDDKEGPGTKKERVMIDEEIERLVGESRNGPSTLDYLTAGSLAAASNMLPSMMQYQNTQRMMAYQMNNAAAYRNSLLNRQMYGNPYVSNFNMGYRTDWGIPQNGGYFRSNYIPYMTYDYGYSSMLNGITRNNTSGSGWNFGP